MPPFTHWPTSLSFMAKDLEWVTWAHHLHFLSVLTPFNSLSFSFQLYCARETGPVWVTKDLHVAKPRGQASYSKPFWRSTIGPLSFVWIWNATLSWFPPISVASFSVSSAGSSPSSWLLNAQLLQGFILGSLLFQICTQWPWLVTITRPFSYHR